MIFFHNNSNEMTNVGTRSCKNSIDINTVIAENL